MIQSINSKFLERHEKKLVVGILLLGLALRIIWAFVSPRFDPVIRANPFHGDASGYHLLAVNLWRGDGFSWDGGHPTAYRMPGYPFFLWALYTLTYFNLAAIRFIQAVLGALTILPVILVGKAADGRFVGILAGFATAIHPMLIYMSSWIYSETLFILLFWIGIYSLVRYLETKGFLHLIISGIGLGIACLVRQEIFPFLFFLAILGCLFRWKREWVIRALTVQLIVIILVIPWIIRNGIVFKSFTPLTTSLGSNFYAGNNPESDGGSAWTYPIQSGSELQSDRILFHESIDWMRSNPITALSLIPKKIIRFFSPIEFETRENPLGKTKLLVNGIYFIILMLACYGGYFIRKNLAAQIILAAILWYLLIAIIYYGGTRIALPVSPGLMIFGAAGVCNLVGRLVQTHAS